MRRKQPAAVSYDVVFAGNMAGAVDNCLRIAGEAAAADQAGYRTALLHICEPTAEAAPVSPEIRACLRGSKIAVLDPQQRVSARLLVLHPPCDAAALSLAADAVAAQRVVIVPDAGSDVAALADAAAQAKLPKITIAPTAAALRERLTAQPGLRLEPKDWGPLPSRPGALLPPSPAAGSLRFGAIIPPDWPQAVDAIREIAGRDPDLDIHVWRDRGARRQSPAVPGGWKVFDGAEISIAWFLRRVDVLLVLVRPGSADVPEAVVGAALAAGKRVAAPSSLAAQLPPGVITAEEGALIAAVRAAPQVRGRAPAGKGAPTAASFLKRLAALTGASAPARRKVSAAGRMPRVLFVPKGGVGIGHVSRLLAIARQAGDAFDPVFVSLSESAGGIEAFGFRTEFIPSAAYAGASTADWDPWFQYELEQLIDAYDASAVVFDGSDPPAVLTRAVASRSWCRGVWVRRGMWAPGYNPSLQRSGNYDVIIEPGEIAAARDRGATVPRRGEAVHVDPVTLLDGRELLPREAAAKALGLDPSRPAVLVQLGSGENRDILGLIDQVVQQCRRFPALQVAVVEWANASQTLSLWPEIMVLKGIPLSLYHRAFDFAISAAGYNSFHELINFGLPSILVPNKAPGMDDQAARAAFAQDEGAAIELGEGELHELPPILDLFMKPEFRSVMQQNCLKLARGNGARAACRIIADLVT